MIPTRPALTLAPSRRSPLLAALWIAMACPLASAQSTPPSAPATAGSLPSFDVATIKPHAGPMRMIGLMAQPDGFAGTIKLPMLVQYAYGLRTEDQVSGGPDWTKTEWFDVQTKIGPDDIEALQKLSPADATARRNLMFQALLAERFKLKAHPATRQLPVFELVVAKSGSKLKDAATDTSDHLEKGKDGKPSTGIHFLKDTSVLQGETMPDFVNFLSQPVAGVGRPVLDKTGLTGTYDFILNWSVYSAKIMVANGVTTASMGGDDAPSIFTALQEVGLKLQPATGPVESIVIDSVERPSAD